MIGLRVRAAREARRMTQEELARATECLTQGAVSHIERGRAYPTRASLAALARALGVRPVDLDPEMGGER